MYLAPSLLTLMLLTITQITWSSDSSDEQLVMQHDNEAIDGFQVVISREIPPKLNPPSPRLLRGSCRFPSYVKTSEDRPSELYAKYGQLRAEPHCFSATANRSTQLFNNMFTLSLNTFVEQGLVDPEHCWIRLITNKPHHDLRELLTKMAIFIRWGADPNIADDKGQVTMLQIVSGLGEAEGVAFLLQRGADPLLRDKFGHNAFDYAKRHVQDQKPIPYLEIMKLLTKHIEQLPKQPDLNNLHEREPYEDSECTNPSFSICKQLFCCFN